IINRLSSKDAKIRDAERALIIKKCIEYGVDSDLLSLYLDQIDNSQKEQHPLLNHEREEKSDSVLFQVKKPDVSPITDFFDDIADFFDDTFGATTPYITVASIIALIAGWLKINVWAGIGGAIAVWVLAWILALVFSTVIGWVALISVISFAVSYYFLGLWWAIGILAGVWVLYFVVSAIADSISDAYDSIVSSIKNFLMALGVIVVSLGVLALIYYFGYKYFTT
ncbi:MAG: hypothetical protein K2N10_05195, partial [Muribaculaceae bacterium]|nr:hypothetical protein [Muribaculaceae bacterium]